MPRRGRNRGIELGVVLLISELLQAGFSTIPPITLITIACQVLLYMNIINPPWEKWDVCISSDKIFSQRDYKALILSMFEHADDMHLYYNMISYMVKGRSLENRYGSTNYVFFLAFISVLTSIMYIVLGQVAAHILSDPFYLKQCAIGFSGVIFALKVITSSEEPYGHTNISGIAVPVRWAAWLELILIHILVPGASFMGHLAGILVGILYCYTPLGYFIDNFITSVSGDCFVHHSNFYKAQERSNVNNMQDEYIF